MESVLPRNTYHKKESTVALAVGLFVSQIGPQLSEVLSGQIVCLLSMKRHVWGLLLGRPGRRAVWSESLSRGQKTVYDWLRDQIVEPEQPMEWGQEWDVQFTSWMPSSKISRSANIVMHILEHIAAIFNVFDLDTASAAAAVDVVLKVVAEGKWSAMNFRHCPKAYIDSVYIQWGQSLTHLLMAHNTIYVRKLRALFDNETVLDLQHYFTSDESFFQRSQAIKCLNYRSKNGVFSRHDNIIKGLQWLEGI